MDPNVKPQTLVETFDQANSNSIRTICSSHNFVDLSCVDMHSARLQTPLRRTMTDERLSSLASLHIHKHKDVIDIDGIIYNRVCLSVRYTSRPLLVTSLMASLFYPFFAVNSLYLTDDTRDHG